MKTMKILMVAFTMFATVFSAKADDDKPITFEQLPIKSQEFIRKYFEGKEISYTKVDQEFFDKSYEVFFVDGSKSEFDANGEWEKIDCFSGKIPDGIVAMEIEDFVKKNHSGQSIVKIERNKKNYEIELSNDLEIKFDHKYNVIGYDH